ncbi:MAG: glycosyl transferase, partial [Acidobacteriota bacterium]
AAVGLADDRWGLPAGVRLLAQVVAALCVAGSDAVVREVALPWNATWDLGVLAVPATMVWLVGLTNIYNFMDGIDGLAASQAIVTAGAMCLLAVCLGREDVAAAMAILGAGVLGFVVLNWAPARIFMGDVGSTFLGFILAGFAVLPASADAETLPLAAWVAVLSPFLFDALWTLARRIVRREPIHKAHRSHMYQMLVQAGWSHARTTLLYTALASFAGIVTVLHYGVHLIPPQIYLAAVLAPLAVPPLLVAAVRRHA